MLGLSTFSLFNVRGLKPLTTVSKVPVIRDLLVETKQLFISLSETWLGDHKDSEISIPGYVPFRGDRKNRKKRRGRCSGGTAMYIRTDIATSAEEILTFSNGVVEVLGVFIKSMNLVVYTLYRSPDNPDARSGKTELTAALEKTQASIDDLAAPTPDIILNGDFNLPNADWSTGECVGQQRVFEEQEMVTALFSLMRSNQMSQFIDVPTHSSNNTLDLLFCNNPNLVHSIDASLSGFSDHMVIQMRVNHKIKNKDNESRKSSKS